MSSSSQDPKPQKLDQNHPGVGSDAWNAFKSIYHATEEVIGVVRRIQLYGAFIEIMPGVQGLLHRSSIVPGQWVNVEQYLQVEDRVKVLIRSIDDDLRRIDLSIPQKHLGGGAIVQRQVEEETAASIADARTKIGLEIRPGRIRRILIADDNEVFRASLAEMLQAASYEVFTVSDGNPLFEKILTFQPDLVLLDAYMDGVNGLDILKPLLDMFPNVYVLLMSGMDVDDPMLECLKGLGHVDYSKKVNLISNLEIFLAVLEEGNLQSIPLQSSQEDTLSEQFSAQPKPKKQRVFRQVYQMLRGLVEDTGAYEGALFCMDMLTRKVNMPVWVDISPSRFEQVRFQLDISPVKDVIIDGHVFYEHDVRDDLIQPKFEKLLPLSDFRSCIGLQVKHVGKDGYALFLFHPTPNYFDANDKRRAEHIAEAIGAIIEHAALAEQLLNNHRFTLVGMTYAGLAHEIDTPIAALDTLIEVAHQRDVEIITHPTQDDSNQLKKVMQLNKDLRTRLRKSVDQLKERTRLYQRLYKPQKGDICQIGSVLKDTDLILAAEKRKHRVQFVIQCPDSLPFAAINDSVLEQILINLLRNSIQQITEAKYPSGKVEIEVLWNQDVKPSLIEIYVTDNGPGIHRNLWELIFKPGFTTREEGSGLGLYLSRELVEKAGGQLVVKDSVILSGTTMLVQLPVYQKE